MSASNLEITRGLQDRACSTSIILRSRSRSSIGVIEVTPPWRGPESPEIPRVPCRPQWFRLHSLGPSSLRHCQSSTAITFAVGTNANVDSWRRCPLSPLKRTYRGRGEIAAFKPYRIQSAALFDHLVGAHEDGLGNRKIERLCGSLVDNEFELRRLLDREIHRFGA